MPEFSSRRFNDLIRRRNGCRRCAPVWSEASRAGEREHEHGNAKHPQSSRNWTARSASSPCCGSRLASPVHRPFSRILSVDSHARLVCLPISGAPSSRAGRYVSPVKADRRPYQIEECETDGRDAGHCPARCSIRASRNQYALFRAKGISSPVRGATYPVSPAVPVRCRAARRTGSPVRRHPSSSDTAGRAMP